MQIARLPGKIRQAGNAFNQEEVERPKIDQPEQLNSFCIDA